MNTGDFEEFFESNLGRVLALATSITGTKADGDDIAAEAFTRAYMRRHRLDDRAPAWVMKVASNLAIDELRKQRKRTATALADHHGHTDVTEAVADRRSRNQRRS